MRISDWSSDVCSSDLMPTLFEKSGAEGDYRRFKFEMTKIVRENALPGYALELELRAEAEPFLRMVRRNLTSEPGAPSPALVQTAPTPGRATPSAQADRKSTRLNSSH